MSLTKQVLVTLFVLVFALSVGGVVTAAITINATTLTLSNSETIDNATNGTVAITSGVLKHAYDSAAYWTATQADAGAVTFDSVSDGTSGFTFSDAINFGVVAINGTYFDVAATTGAVTLTQQAVATAPITITGIASGTAAEVDINTQNVGGSVIDVDWAAASTQTAALAGLDIDLTNLTADGTNTVYGIHVNDHAGSTTSTEYGIYVEGTNWDYGLYVADTAWFNGVITGAYDSAAYWTATQADGGGVTFDSVSDGTASFTFGDPVIFSGGSEYQPIKAGALSSTTPGTGVVISATTPRAVDIHVDDNDAAIAQGTLLSAGRFRLMKYADSITEDYAVHGLAKYSGLSKGGWGAGVMGAVETTGAVTLAGQSHNLLTGVLGRFGTAATLNTNTANDRIACVTAFNNNSVSLTGSGKAVGVLVMEGISGSEKDLDYGLEIRDSVATTGITVGASTTGITVAGATTTGISVTGNSTTPISINSNAGTISGEVHGLDVAWTGTLSSGDAIVGGNFAVTTAGTAGVWASGIYAKVTQGTTKNVNGYISGAEFEVINANTNVSDWFPLVLNANSTTNSSHSSYIALRDYGSTALNSLLWFGDASVASQSDSALISSVQNDHASTHTIRIIIGETPYWILLSNSGPSN